MLSGETTKARGPRSGGVVTGVVVTDATAVGLTVSAGAGTVAVVVVPSEVVGREVVEAADPRGRRVLGDAEVGALEREGLDPLHAPSELTAVTTRNSDTPSLRVT
jgi:hypothetical protein